MSSVYIYIKLKGFAQKILAKDLVYDNDKYSNVAIGVLAR